MTMVREAPAYAGFPSIRKNMQDRVHEGYGEIRQYGKELGIEWLVLRLK